MALNIQNDMRVNSAKIIKEMIQATKNDLYKFSFETQNKLDYILQIVDTNLKQTPVNDREVQTEPNEELMLLENISMRQDLLRPIYDTGEDSLQQQQSTIPVSFPITENNFDHSNTVTNINNNCSQNLDQRITVKQEEPPNNHQTQSNDMWINIESDSSEQQSVICLSSSSNSSFDQQSVIRSSSSSTNSTNSSEHSDWKADHSDITSESEVDVEEDDINRPSTSTQRATRPGPSRQNWQDACQELLEKLWQCDDSIPFREPVDPLKHPNYHKVINTPMDLRTVKEELLVGNYKSPSEFAKNMKLIFANSKKYNTNTRSKIYSMTIRLSAMFEEHMLKIMNNWKSANRRKTNSESKKSKKRSPTKSQLSNGVSKKIKGPTKRKAVSSEEDDDDGDDDDDVDTNENEDQLMKHTEEDEEDEEVEHSQKKKQKKVVCDENVDNDVNTGIKTKIKQEPMTGDEQQESNATASGSQQCKDANCRLASCQRMKRVVTHIKTCKRRTYCLICKQLVVPCCHHAKHCQDAQCGVLSCFNIKHKLRQQQHQQWLQRAELLRRRMPVLMNGSGGPDCGLKTVPSATHAETYRETGSNTADTLQQKSTSHAAFPHTNRTTERQHAGGYAGPSCLSQSQQQQQQQPAQPGIGGIDEQMPGQAGQVVANQALQELMQMRGSSNTPEQQNKILHIFERNPALLAEFIKLCQAAQDEDE